MGQLARVIRFSGQFVSNRRYRNHVLDVITRHVRAGENASDSQEVSARDYSWLAGRKVYLIGGCELTYLKESLESLGIQTHHTFDHGGASEPLAEVANSSAPLWSLQPDYVILSQVQLYRGLVQKLQSNGLVYERSEQQSDLDDLMQNAEGAIQGIRERFACPIFVMTYPLVYRPAFGVHEYRSIRNAYSLAEIGRAYELAVYQLTRRFEGVYVLDVNLALEREGKNGHIDETNADGVYEHFTRTGASRVATQFAYQLEVLEPSRRRIKCAVFDLDGTLWTGVLREDGPQGVAVRLNYLTVLGHLTRRGIILGICSKNDEVEIEHLPTLLGEDLASKFVARKLNWRPKSENLRALAKELNIGLDSIAFFDDNAFEREEVRVNAPEVLVLSDMVILDCLRQPEFEPFGEFTAESSSRTVKYVQQAEREAAASSATSIEQFLRTCQLRLTLRRPVDGEISRVHELLQRTNQLNATLRRSSLADLTGYYRKPIDFEVSVALLEDKFGDYGLIGLGIAAKQKKEWSIIELAFSCRAMGKGVENALVLQLAHKAYKAGASALGIDFRRTDRNQQLLSILQNLNFEGAVSEVGAEGRLVRRLGESDGAPSYPVWFEIRG